MGDKSREDALFRELDFLLNAMQEPQQTPARMHYVHIKPLIAELEKAAEGRAAKTAIRERLFDLDVHARMLAGLENDGHPTAQHRARALGALNVLRNLFAKPEPPPRA